MRTDSTGRRRPIGLVAVLLTVTVAGAAVPGCDERRLPVTEYSVGYNAGVAAARKAKAEGELMRGVYAVGMALRVGKIDEQKSDEWNGGFQQGWKDEINK